jgi:hypothetical protein
MLGRNAAYMKNLSGNLEAAGIWNWNLLKPQSDELRTSYAPHTYKNSYVDTTETVLKAEVKCPSCRQTSNCLKSYTGINCRSSTHLTYDTRGYIPLTCGGSLTSLLYHSAQVPSDIPKPGKTTIRPNCHRRGLNVKHRLPNVHDRYY